MGGDGEGAVRTTKLLQHLVVTGNAFVGHYVRARANVLRICLFSQKKKLSPGQSRGGGQGGGGGGERGKDGGDWLRIGPGPGGKEFLDKRRRKKGREKS